MKYCEWKTGASLCFNRRYDIEELSAFKAAGVDCVELSFSEKDYFEKLRLTEDPQRVRALADEAGVELWSIHLPFSGALDISLADDEKRGHTLAVHRALIDAAAKAGIKVAVVHPSSEPIADDERPSRLARSKEKLTMLAAYCRERGMRLAVENLPRTCLIRRSDEAEYIFDDNPDLYMVFDTNHLLGQDNTEFINIMGSHIITLHVSDYDFIDERHQLPLEGKNDWKRIISALEGCGYTGPWLYEVGAKGVYQYGDFAENRRRLAALL